MKKIDKLLYEKAKEIRQILIDNGFDTDYLSVNIIKNNIYFNNEYWLKEKKQQLNFAEPLDIDKE